MTIEPTETDLVGNWIPEQGRLVGDGAEGRIGRLIERYLRKIAISPKEGAWEVLYQDPLDGRYWELTYPASEMHGGGPRRLTVIDNNVARTKYGLRSE
jgi:Immunity protein 27